MQLDFSPVPPKHPQPGVTTRRLDYAQMTVVLYEFEPNAVFPLHHHPEEQLVVVLDGSGTITVGDRDLTLKTGDSAVAGSNMPHGCRAGAQGLRMLNILSPARVGEGVINLVRS